MADEQVKDSLEESSDQDGADRTAEVPTMSFDDAKKALGEDVMRPELDEQPTKKIAALSDEDAEKVTGTRRAVRVFKHPSKPPPPRLELPLATAQFQAIDEELLPDAPIRKSARGQITAAALILSVAMGTIVAWATHEASVSQTPLTPLAAIAPPTSTASSTPTSTSTSEVTPSPSPSPSPPPSPPPAAAAPEVPSEPEPAGNALEQVVPQRTRAEPTGPRRAETLLAEAADLRGGERLAALEAASRADASNPHVAAALAEFHMENDPHEALEWALQASQLRRRRANYHDLVADAYERIGNLNDAADARATAVSLREGD